MTEGGTVKNTSSSKNGRPGFGENLSMRLLLLLALAVCSLGSLCLYSASTRLVRLSADGPPNVNPARLDMTTQTEVREVEETEAALASLGRARGQVMQSAMLAEISGKGPFGRPSVPAAVRLPAEEDAPAVWDASEAEAAPPPTVTVVAVLIQGSERVAMIDAGGEEGALLVREGARFSGGSARITEINPEGVRFTWMEGLYEAALSR